MAENVRYRLALIGQQPGQKGRATKYDPDLHCQMIRDMAQRGEFPEAWAAEIGITLNTMRVWVNTHEEFCEAAIIARHLLQTYWTRELASARNNPMAKPGIYSIIARRFPELYGRNPVDLFAFLHTPLDTGQGGGQEHSITTADGVQQMTDEEIQKRLETLRQRRAAEQGDQ